MSEELLPYYDRELAFIRELGAEFASRYPRIAGRLRLSEGGSQDPHVERLIQAFALLNARLRHKIDDDLPEITDALLGVLYPHLNRPIPSAAITQFLPDRKQADLTSGHLIPRGTAIETERVLDMPCRFQTCYPVTLWPCEVRQARLAPHPFESPQTRMSGRCEGVLHMELGTFAPSVKFEQFTWDSLRFYLHPGRRQDIDRLYELLFEHTVEVAIARGPGDPKPILLDPKEVIRPVGFGEDEGLLPYPARSFLGYRLLVEYFVLPHKFRFFDLAGLKNRLAGFEDSMHLYFFVNNLTPELAQDVRTETFRLGATPMVNLFTKTAEPISLTHQQSEYRVVADARRERGMEIWNIDRVTSTDARGGETEYRPFFSFHHASEEAEQRAFWHVSRRPSLRDGEAGSETATDLFLSFVDLDFSPNDPDRSFTVETTCFNRDLPSKLPFTGSRPTLDMPNGRGPVGSVVCLSAPTPTHRPKYRQGAYWRLLSHLSLNHLSITSDEDGTAALREILKLYDPIASPESSAAIAGILKVASRRVTGRAGVPRAAVCRGIEIELDLDESRFGGSAYLLPVVLDRFLALYANVNSFTRLICQTKRGGRVETWRWPARTGEKVLI